MLVGWDYIDVDIKDIFNQIWRLFTDWQIPIINLSPGYLLIALMVLGILSFIIKSLIGMSGGVSISVGKAIKNRKKQKK